MFEVRVEREDAIDTREVLSGRGDEAEERKVLGEEKGGGRRNEPRLAGERGGFKKSSFKFREEFEGASGAVRGMPDFA